MTEVMAAAQKMTPKMRRPQSPSRAWNACAAGFAVLRGEVERDAGGGHAEDGEEQDEAHQPGHRDAGQRAAGDAGRALLLARLAPCREPVGAGVGDVAAHRAADDRDDRGEVDDSSGMTVCRSASPTGGLRDDRDDERQADHHQAEPDDGPVEQQARRGVTGRCRWR